MDEDVDKDEDEDELSDKELLHTKSVSRASACRRSRRPCRERPIRAEGTLESSSIDRHLRQPPLPLTFVAQPSSPFLGPHSPPGARRS